jgi:hypothetical protein
VAYRTGYAVGENDVRMCKTVQNVRNVEHSEYITPHLSHK